MIAQAEWARTLVALVGVSSVSLLLLAAVLGISAVAFRVSHRRAKGTFAGRS